MVKHIALIVAIAAFNANRTAGGDDTSGDPFRLHLPKALSEDKDGKTVYIPGNLDDCFAELEKTLSKTEIERMKKGTEDQIDRYYHISSSDQYVEIIEHFPQWLHDRWRLGSRSHLATWFNVRGIDDSDDMSDIIIHSFWRHLNAKPIDLDGQIRAHQVYIPKDLDDCFAQLEKRLSKETVAKMKGGPEKDMVLYHHGFGTWLRNRWGLWKGSRLSKWFNDRGIQHPDDMSGIILRSFWRHLNGKPIKLDDQIKHYQDYWKKVREEKALQKKTEGKSQ